MKKKGIFKKLLFYGLTAFAFFSVLPTFFPSLTFSKKLGFGLDLVGGLELTYSVDYRSAIGANILKSREGIEDRLIEEMVNHENKSLTAGQTPKDFNQLKKEERKKYLTRFSVKKIAYNRMEIKFKNPADVALFTGELIDDIDRELVRSGSGELVQKLTLPPKVVSRIRSAVLTQTIDIIRKRVEAFGLVEPDVRSAGSSRIQIQLPGVKEERMNFFRKRIGQTAQLTFRIVDDQSDFLEKTGGKLPEYLAEKKTFEEDFTHTIEWAEGTLRSVKKSELISFLRSKNADGTRRVNIPDDHMIGLEQYTSKDPESGQSLGSFWRALYIFRRVEVSGDHVTKAFVGLAGSGEDIAPNTPYVSLEFDRRGSKAFEKTTIKHVKKRMAIMLDDEVTSAPNLQERISGGRARITLGDGSRKELLDEANGLTTVLTHGAYKAPVHKVQDRAVGPKLGRDTIRAGVTAMVVGSILVIIFMLLYYRIAGFVANIALILNMVYIVAILIVIDAALTLPGIAGILLTIGMAVDANVIINERVREEIRAGRSLRAAIQTGYSRAFWTVFDANITTALAGLLLLVYTSGPLHNFAVTLLIGIACTMLTAVFVTRRIFEILMDRGLTEIKF
jgi:preprotein translocase subunit SecD